LCDKEDGLRATSPAPALLVEYAGTVSKTLAPTLRIGWLVLPAHLADDVAHRGQASGAWPSIIEQATLATMIQRGDLEHTFVQCADATAAAATPLSRRSASPSPSASAARPPAFT
jgi:DNA-binding transcriptional MocR family regulator